MNRKRILIFLIALAALSVVGFLGYQRLSASAQSAVTSTPSAKAKEDVVTAEGNVVPKSASDLAFRTGGRVIEVLVAEGDVVKQGQPLIRLQDDELKIGVAQAQAALDLAQANVAQIKQGARPEEIAAAEGALRAAQAQFGAAAADRDRLTGGATDAAIAAAQARLAATLVDQKLAQDAYDKVTQCFTIPQKDGGKDEVCPGLGTPEEQMRTKLNAANEAVTAARKALAETTTGSAKQVQAAQANVAAAVAQRDVAQARLDQVKSGATQAQIDAAQAGVAQAQAVRDAAQAALDEATLKAPFAGTIALINVDAGQVIGPGLVVVSIADLQSWEVETDDLSEVDVVNVQPGQAVALTFDALPGVTLKGVVTSITPRAENKRGDVTYTVKINIERPDPRLRWGMTAQVDIPVKSDGSRRNNLSEAKMDISIMLRLMHNLEQLRQHERWTRQQLETYQADAVRRLRDYAYAHSPFYQRFHQGLFERPLNELPVLTKAMLMEHFDELVTDRTLRLEEVRAYAAHGEAGQRYRKRYWVNATSGSSGQPGFFLFDQVEWTHILASFARSQEWSGLRINLAHHQRMATVASISPWHMSSQVAATVKSWWRPSLRLPASQPLPQTVEQLDAWQPEVLIAYASMAQTLAEEQLAGRLHIHPQAVYAASEVLTARTRERVRAAWGAEPFNQYVATETASIAAEHRSCQHLHFFEDLVIVENVDEHYQPVPPGEYGAKLLVTTLFSHTQPLIRYELNDSIRVRREAHDCPLPFAVLDDVQGRVEDALHLPAVTGGEIVVRPLVFTRIMDIVPIGGWQVVQQADQGLVLLLTGVRDGLTDEALVDQLTRSLAQAGAHAPYIQVQRVSAIPKTASGKAPLVKAYRPASAT